MNRLLLLTFAAASASAQPPVPTQAEYDAACKVLVYVADQALKSTPQRQAVVHVIHDAYGEVRGELEDPSRCALETEYFRRFRVANGGNHGTIVIPGRAPRLVPWKHREIEELVLRIEEGLSFSAIEEALAGPVLPEGWELPEVQIPLELGGLPASLSEDDVRRLRSLVDELEARIEAGRIGTPSSSGDGNDSP